MVSCSIASCPYRSRDNRREATKKYVGISLHSFPLRNPTLLDKWVEATGMHAWLPSKHSKVCSVHFEDRFVDRTGQNVRLRENAIPTLYLLCPPPNDKLIPSSTTQTDTTINSDFEPQNLQAEFETFAPPEFLSNFKSEPDDGFGDMTDTPSVSASSIQDKENIYITTAGSCCPKIEKDHCHAESIVERAVWSSCESSEVHSCVNTVTSQLEQINPCLEVAQSLSSSINAKEHLNDHMGCGHDALLPEECHHVLQCLKLCNGKKISIIVSMPQNECFRCHTVSSFT